MKTSDGALRRNRVNRSHPGVILADPTGGHSNDAVMLPTPRERLVAIAVATGLSNRQVAAALSMAAKTVECHLGRIYAKLGVASRLQLAVAIGHPTRPDPDDRWPDLSPTEQQVVSLVGLGMTTRLAAKRLYLSPKTVEYHLARIYRKLQITSRSQLPGILDSLCPSYPRESAEQEALAG